MSEQKENLPPIEFEMETLTHETIQGFGQATLSEHFKTIPPTMATRFRKAEFQWLEKMKVDMRTLLHVEQEYEYVSPFQVGDKVFISSKIASWKERKSMTFVTIETKVLAGKLERVRSQTTFLLQTGAAK